jgi:hypothetical protein
MTPPDKPDPLVSLWHTGSGPDAQQMLRQLQSYEQSRKRMRLVLMAVLCTVSLMLLLAETVERMPTHGVLSAIWLPLVASCAIWWRRGRVNRIDMLSADTARLLRRMIARAKADLFIARCLYIGVPLGAAAGGTLTQLFKTPQTGGQHSVFGSVLAIAGGAILAAMFAFGVLFERSRRRQIEELRGKLQSVTSNM